MNAAGAIPAVRHMTGAKKPEWGKGNLPPFFLRTPTNLPLTPSPVPDAGRQSLAVVRNATDNTTGAELELNFFQNAKAGSEYAAH
jgi:hypothetical protein